MKKHPAVSDIMLVYTVPESVTVTVVDVGIEEEDVTNKSTYLLFTAS
jgi:hypothetical protein